MTVARPIHAGDTHFISRRVTQRMFLLRPRPIVEQAFLYVAAIAAKHYDIELHAMIVMSNHWHALLTDTKGKLPAFLHYVHEFVAKILNCSMGRFENLWSSEKPSIVTLEGEEDVMDKLAYLMANPVAGQLVAHGRDWPGVRRMWQVGQESVTVKRPEIFYRKGTKMPDEATLTFTRPPAFSHLDDEQASVALCQAVAEREAAERKHILARKGRFMGVDAILRQRLTATPKTYARKFGMSPRIGAKNKWARTEAVRRLAEWVEAYKKAYEAFRAGHREVEFPAGTYAMRRFAGVCCAASL